MYGEKDVCEQLLKLEICHPGHTYTISEEKAGTDLQVKKTVLSNSRDQRRWDQVETKGFVAIATSEIQARESQGQSLGMVICVWKCPPPTPVSPSSGGLYSSSQ